MAEQAVQRFRFRIKIRSSVSEFPGRAISDGEQVKLQVWIKTPEHENMILEVAPVESLDVAWPLFLALAEYRGVVPLEYRTADKGAALGAWQPLPGATPPSAPESS